MSAWQHCFWPAPKATNLWAGSLSFCLKLRAEAQEGSKVDPHISPWGQNSAPSRSGPGKGEERPNKAKSSHPKWWVQFWIKSWCAKWKKWDDHAEMPWEPSFAQIFWGRMVSDSSSHHTFAEMIFPCSQRIKIFQTGNKCELFGLEVFTSTATSALDSCDLLMTCLLDTWNSDISACHKYIKTKPRMLKKRSRKNKPLFQLSAWEGLVKALNSFESGPFQQSKFTASCYCSSDKHSLALLGFAQFSCTDWKMSLKFLSCHRSTIYPFPSGRQGHYKLMGPSGTGDCPHPWCAPSSPQKGFFSALQIHNVLVNDILLHSWSNLPQEKENRI